MKFKLFIPALIIGAALSASADGYKDGIDYYKAGQFGNAKEILERTLNEPATDKAMAYYYLGQTALAQKDVTAAKANFDKGIAANADCAYNYVGLGAVNLLSKNVKAAEDNFNQAKKLAKKNNEITVDIARAYFQADPVAYAAQVQKLLDKAHKDSKHAEPAIYILEGDIQFANHELGNAAAKYEQAITFEEDNPEGYVKYANAYMGVNPIYGVQKLEELLTKQPNSALAQRELAEKYFETNQWVKAADQYGKYIQNPNHFPEDKERYAGLLYAVGIGMDDAQSAVQFQKSLDVANDLLATTPNNFVMQRMRMLDLAKLNRNEEAVTAAESFFKLPESGAYKFQPNDYSTFATVLENLGQDSLALIQYEKAVAVDPSRADMLKNLSTAYTKNNKFAQAAETFDKYVAAQGENASLTDYLQSSGRWLNAASHSDTEEERAAAAEAGLVAINKVIDEATTPLPMFYQRQGRLNFVKANKTDENVLNSYTKVLELLDADPANADPANPKNQIGLYSEAYLFLGNYYQENEDKEKRDEMYQKSDEYKKLLQQ